MERARILAYVTGTVDQELQAWNEYLAAENRIMKAQWSVTRASKDFWRSTSAPTECRPSSLILAPEELGVAPDATGAGMADLVKFVAA